MANKVSAQATRGMRDILPKEAALRKKVTNVISEVYAQHGFLSIETPSVENISLLTSGEGGDNEKQIFKVLKRGITAEKFEEAQSSDVLVDSGLRFDLTVPLSRFYAANAGQLPNPCKTVQIGNVWRAERPQKGRFRQFVQCDIDIIGEESIFAEKELITTTAKALQAVGFEGFTIRINDRRILKAIIMHCGFQEEDFEAVCIIFDKLDKIAAEGVQKELEEKGYAQEAVAQLMSFIAEMQDKSGLEIVAEIADQEVIAELSEVMELVEQLAEQKYTIAFDPTLVRGMGYYTGMIFEVEDSEFPGSIAAGGRYDKMIEKYAGKATPACGFSIGFERIMSLIQERELFDDKKNDQKAVLFDEKEVEINQVLQAVEQLRKEGEQIHIFKKRKNTKVQLDELLELGCTTFAILHTNEDKIVFKDLQ